MTRDQRLKIKQLILIVTVWMIVGFFITVYDYLVIHTDDLGQPSQSYSFLLSSIRNVGAGLIGGIAGGSLLVFYVNVKYVDKPYIYTILVVSLSFVIVVAFIALVMGITLVPLRTGRPFADPVTR